MSGARAPNAFDLDFEHIKVLSHSGISNLCSRNLQDYVDPLPTFVIKASSLGSPGAAKSARHPWAQSGKATPKVRKATTEGCITKAEGACEVVEA